MREILERVVFYTLGGFVGFIVIWLFASVGIYILNSICGVLIGIILFILIYEYNKERIMKRNNKLRDETVALITHEMKTGLTSTGWAIQLILQNYSDSLKEEDKKMLESSVSSIHGIVMHSINLLNISLLDIKKLSLSLEWVNLDQVEKMFKETIDRYMYGVKRKDIILSSEIKLDKDKAVEVDMVRLRIIFENLLENALQYTIEPKKEILVKIFNDDRHMYFSVKDGGIGIPKDEQKKIFGEFYRATNARKSKHGGSGIGLYTCKQYVTAHKGTIDFESIENEGTTFEVSIPLKTSADTNDFLKKL